MNHQTPSLPDFLINMSGPLTYTLTNDYMFRALMQESNESLRHLLSALLPVPYEEIRSCEITNPIILGRAIDDKTCILDVRVCLNNDRLINLEMQMTKYEHWANRSLFYLCRLFCNIKAGNDYGKILPAIHIGILNFQPFEDVQKFYSRYELTEAENRHLYTGNFSLRVLDLSQTDTVSQEELATGAVSSELYNWARLFRATTWEEIKMLATENDYIATAARRFHILTQDQDIQLQCEARERYEFDMASARAEGLRKGKKQGIAIGEQRINQLQKRLLADNRTDDLLHSIEDPAYQEQLMKEYGITADGAQ